MKRQKELVAFNVELVEADVELHVNLNVEPEAESARFAAATRSMHCRFRQSKTAERGGGMPPDRLRRTCLSFVVTGLVPVIPLRMAMRCLINRDGRDKPGHDRLK